MGIRFESMSYFNVPKKIFNIWRYFIPSLISRVKYIISKLGIRGAKGAPLPRLCFAQLAFVLCVKCYFVVKSITLRTHGRTDTQTPTII